MNHGAVKPRSYDNAKSSTLGVVLQLSAQNNFITRRLNCLVLFLLSFCLSVRVQTSSGRGWANKNQGSATQIQIRDRFV